MAAGTVSSVITARFIQKLELTRAGTLSSASTLSGTEATTVTLSGLELGSKVFSNAIRGLNNVYNFLNFTQYDLSQLSKITEEMIDVVEQAAKGGIGSNQRSSLNGKFQDLAGSFKKVIEDSVRGEYSDIKIEDIAAIFKTVGLSKENSDKLAEVVNSFILSANSDGEEVLASDASTARRPVHIPRAAYGSYTSVTSSVPNGAYGAPVTITGTASSSSGGNDKQGAFFADINEDGNQDLIQSYGATLDFGVRYGNGDGTFKAVQTLGAGTPSAVTDFNNDGNLDILAIPQDNTGIFSIFLGNGDGTFKAPSTKSNSHIMSTAATGDFNNDGNEDILTSAWGMYNSIYLGNGNGTFKAQQSYHEPAMSNGRYIEIADFNGDGRDDIINLNGVAGAGEGKIYVSLSNVDGSFLAPVSHTVFPGVELLGSMKSGDLNGDGFLDLALGGTSLGVMLGNGDGTFKAITSFGGSDHYSMNISDVNGDGELDLITGGASTMSVFLGNGDGTFKVRTSKSIPGASNNHSLVLTDLNNDGIQDIYTRTRNDNDGVYAYGDGAAGETVVHTARKVKDFKTLFETGRNISTRASASLMLADLKSLKEQLDTNLEAITQAKTFTYQNIQLASATGFAFLEAANEVTANTKDPNEIVALVRAKLRSADPKALSQIANLDAITTAALTTTY